MEQDASVHVDVVDGCAVRVSILSVGGEDPLVLGPQEGVYLFFGKLVVAHSRLHRLPVLTVPQVQVHSAEGFFAPQFPQKLPVFTVPQVQVHPAA